MDFCHERSFPTVYKLLLHDSNSIWKICHAIVL